VRAVAVVVLDEHPERPLEVPLADDQEPVETFGPRGSDEALGDRVRLRRSDRCADDLEAFAFEGSLGKVHLRTEAGFRPRLRPLRCGEMR
jgi:hypothetical protein